MSIKQMSSASRLSS